MKRVFIVCYIGKGNSIVRDIEFDTEQAAETYILEGQHSHLPSELFIVLGLRL